MSQLLNADNVAVLDVLRNPLGGSHWLPVGYGYTPLSLTVSPPYQKSPCPQTSSAEELELFQEKSDFLTKDVRLPCDRDQFSPEIKSIPQGELFKKYIDRKLQCFGRKSYQTPPAPKTVRLATSDKDARTVPLMPEPQMIMERSETHIAGNLADAAVRENGSTQDGAPWSSTLGASPRLSFEQATDLQPSDEWGKQDKLTHLSPTGASLSPSEADSRASNPEWASAEFEQDVKTYVDALCTDRAFPKGVEASPKSSCKAPLQGEQVSVALGKLFHSLIDDSAGLGSDQRHRSQPSHQRGSDIARPPTKLTCTLTYIR